ncbi:N-acetyltransferase family protein [Dokdonia sinensis]|uniref:N-acetyltransferase family protein n=2 Tax=Dokdonia sinensis TaxID=2479847 RepID=A0A3M0GL93_9FLAO|nr:N-acetyltransferase family protein [Dokdonia sinensis]
MDYTIREFEKRDFPTCAIIYQEGLDTGIATFETKVPDYQQWNTKYLEQCRFVILSKDEVLGWIALTPFSNRKVYSGVAEVSLYISKTARGNGLGTALLKTCILQSEKEGFWTLQAKIFLQNKGSLHLFETCGFRKVGVREKLGMRNGTWYDNILLERRTQTA